MSAAGIVATIVALLVLAGIALRAMTEARNANVAPHPEGGRPWRLQSPKGTRLAWVQKHGERWHAHLWRHSEGVLVDERFDTYEEAQVRIMRAVQLERTFDRLGL